MESKNLLLRLDPTLAAQLQAVAEVEGQPVSEVIREAIKDLVAARRKDRRFQQRLRQTARDHDKLLRLLREEGR